jgi:hypothetical protein
LFYYTTSAATAAAAGAASAADFAAAVSAALAKRDRPAAGAVADQDTAGLDDLPCGEEIPSKRQAAASISLSSLGESEVGSIEYQKKTRGRTASFLSHFSRKLSATREFQCSDIGTVLSLAQIAARF